VICYCVAPVATPHAMLKSDLVFSLIEKAVADGARCPTNADIAAYLRTFGLPSAPTSIPDIMRRLTREERLIVRVYARNWRDVVVLSGPYAGRATKPPPHGGKPYAVIDAKERRRRDAHGNWPHRRR
jgi:hypothetical protein